MVFIESPKDECNRQQETTKKIHTKQHLPNQRSTSGSYTNITQIDPIPDDKFTPQKIKRIKQPHQHHQCTSSSCSNITQINPMTKHILTP